MSANALSAVSLAVLVLLAPHGVGHAQPAPQPLPSAAAAGSPLPRPSVDTLRLLLEAEAAETARLARQALDKARGQDGPTSRAVVVPAAAPGALPTLPASLGGGLPDSLASPPPPKLLEINGPAEDLRARLRLADVEAVVSRRQPELPGVEPLWRLESINSTQVVLTRPVPAAAQTPPPVLARKGNTTGPAKPAEPALERLVLAIARPAAASSSAPAGGRAGAPSAPTVPAVRLPVVTAPAAGGSTLVTPQAAAPATGSAAASR
jgi:hypothetical protein